jgi:hypothetical protein
VFVFTLALPHKFRLCLVPVFSNRLDGFQGRSLHPYKHLQSKNCSNFWDETDVSISCRFLALRDTYMISRRRFFTASVQSEGTKYSGSKNELQVIMCRFYSHVVQMNYCSNYSPIYCSSVHPLSTVLTVKLSAVKCITKEHKMSAVADSVLQSASARPKLLFSETHNYNYNYSILCHSLPCAP